VFLRRSLFAGFLALLALHVPQAARAQDAEAALGGDLLDGVDGS